jgi:hypothetical protein
VLLLKKQRSEAIIVGSGIDQLIDELSALAWN